MTLPPLGYWTFGSIATTYEEERTEKGRSHDVDKVLAPLTEREWRELRGVTHALYRVRTPSSVVAH